jgi:hypothetical protein
VIEGEYLVGGAVRREFLRDGRQREQGNCDCRADQERAIQHFGLGRACS